MSIASRIEAIEQHLTDDYSVLTLAGADLTNVDKNILNLKPTWKERLLYFMNNGTQQVWNNWDKVTGEGTTLTLNNTEEAPMSLVYKGNTLQNGTPTPDSPVPIQVVSGDNSIEVKGKNLLKNKAISQTINGVQFTVYSDGSVKAVGTASANTALPITGANNVFVDLGLQNGTYRLSGTTGGAENTWAIYMAIKHSNNTTATFYNTNGDLAFTKATGDTFFSVIRIENGTTVNQMFYPMIRVSSVLDDTYEPYKGASYPINLGGKNLWSLGNLSFTGWGIGNTNLLALINSLDIGTYTLTLKAKVTSLTAPQTTYRWGIYASGSGFSLEGRTNLTQTLSVGDIISNTITITINSTNKGNFTSAYTYTISSTSGSKAGELELYETQLEKGNQATDYEPYTPNPIQLLHIPNTNYYDKIDKSSGKNLFNQSISDTNCNIVNGMIVPNTTSTDFYIKGAPAYSEANKFLTLESGNYYIKTTNSNIRITMYGDNGNLDTVSNQPVTLSSTINFGGIRVRSLNSTSLQNIPFGIIISKTDSEYEPYGTGWYVKKEIGKVVLNGSESWGVLSETTYYGLYFYAQSDKAVGIDNLISNKFIVENSNSKNCISGRSNNQAIVITLAKSICEYVLSSFKTWLSSNNVEVRYVLETPTYTLIEDTTLINQLETIKKSYEGQTNITQENNDLHFILDITALKEM